MGRMTYIDQIEETLGIAETGVTRARLELFDFGRRIGVAITYPDGRKHAVRSMFQPGWEAEVIQAFRDWAA